MTAAAVAATAASAEQVLAIAASLLDPRVVIDTVPGPLPGASLADGLAGTALLHARLAACDPRFEEAAARHWAEAGRLGARSAGAGAGAGAAGIYSGPGGLAASLIIGSGYLRDPGPCRTAVARATRWVSARALAIAGWQRARLAGGATGTPWQVYDLVSGLAGLGRVLLAADAAGLGDAARPGLAAARDTLAAMVLAASGPRPGWWQPASGVARSPATLPDAGVAATGLAHGIAGPLAFLAACEQAGYHGGEQVAAISEAARWLLSWRGEDSWPPQVTRDDLESGPPARKPGGRRDAWCYGAPGISRALIAAGHALGDQELAGAGRAVLAAQARRAERRWDTEGPTLCHGHAGVLQCAAGTADLRDAAARAVTAAFGIRYRFGFRHAAGPARSDRPGFLTGAAGVALALADHASLPGPEPLTRWDALLLLS